MDFECSYVLEACAWWAAEMCITEDRRIYCGIGMSVLEYVCFRRYMCWVVGIWC